MKKLLACVLAVGMLAVGLFGCEKDPDVTVITYDTNITTATTEATETEEVTAAPTESEVVTTLKHFEMMYCQAETQRDAVGNIWLNVLVAYQNVSEETIRMSYGDIRVYSDGEEGLVLQQVPCYPHVLEPGQTGYYFEQRQVDIDEDKPLFVEMLPDSAVSAPIEQFAIEDVQIRDSAFGIEVSGMYQAPNHSDLVCVVVVLFNENSDPFYVLFDYLPSNENSFVLSGDKLPEGLTTADITSYIAYAYAYEN